LAIALKSITTLFVLLALAALGLWVIASQQPSRAIHRYDSAIVVAVKATDGATTKLAFDGMLWSARVSHTLVGDPEAYWTHFYILRPGSNPSAQLRGNPALEDAYAAHVQLSDIPSLALGFLRVQHLSGLTQRPQINLENGFDGVSDRPDIMPTQASLDATLALDPNQSVTMMNFLEYVPDAQGDKAKGRAKYLQYGAEAMKAVHAVGGQLLFAGQVREVLVAPKGETAPREWDDLAAMIYPDPSSIFAMEQNEDYVASLGFRDASLKRTHVIASLAY